MYSLRKTSEGEMVLRKLPIDLDEQSIVGPVVFGRFVHECPSESYFQVFDGISVVLLLSQNLTCSVRNPRVHWTRFHSSTEELTGLLQILTLKGQLSLFQKLLRSDLAATSNLALTRARQEQEHEPKHQHGVHSRPRRG